MFTCFSSALTVQYNAVQYVNLFVLIFPLYLQYNLEYVSLFVLIWPLYLQYNVVQYVNFFVLI